MRNSRRRWVLAPAFVLFFGCATTVHVGPACVVDGEIATGTKIRCVEIERASISETVREAGATIGGLLRGLLGGGQ